MASFRKQDLVMNPTQQELNIVYTSVNESLQQSQLLWKIIGGYATQRYGSGRKTKDIDFAVLMSGSSHNVGDLIAAMHIPNLHRLEEGGFGYLVGDRLIEVDFIDSRTFNYLQAIPQEEWAKENPVLCSSWLCLIKLRAWRARNLRMRTVDGKAFSKDAADVHVLVNQLVVSQNGRKLPKEILQAGQEAANAFVQKDPDYVSLFSLLGW